MARASARDVRLIELALPAPVDARGWVSLMLPSGLVRRFPARPVGMGRLAIRVRWADNDPAARLLWSLVEGAAVHLAVDTPDQSAQQRHDNALRIHLLKG